MNCEESLLLLSEYHDGTLGEIEFVLIQTHMADCPPCMDLYYELHTIVVAAAILSKHQEITFPDPDILWMRLQIS